MFLKQFRHRGFRYFLFTIAFLTSAAIPSSRAKAQVLYGSLQGNVTDSSSAALTSAMVKATNSETAQTRETTTNASGGYIFPDLIAGTYTLTVTAQGFQTVIQNGIALSANDTLREDVQLKISGTSQQVVVTGTPPPLQTDSPEVKSDIEAETLASLPIPVGRDYQNSLRIVPGVSVSGGGTLRGSNPSGSLTMNVNGSPSNGNNTRIDGAVSSNTYDSTLVAYLPTLDSIASIDVVTNSFAAEDNQAGGSAVSIHIKSGTNTLHGSGFDFFTNQNFQAHPAINPLNSPKPAYSFNQYGGTLGGPIKKNKIFFFGSFEGIRWRQVYTGFGTVPTDAAKAGNLSESPYPIYDPATGAASGTGRTAFPGNKIPAMRFSPITQKLLSLWPEPNVAGLANNYFGSAQSPYDRYTGDGKINWNVNDKLLIFVRAGVSRFDEYNAQIFGPQLGGYTFDNQQSGHAYGGVDSLTGAATYVFTPNLILDGYFGFTLDTQNAQQDRLNEDIGSNILGIPGTNGSRSFEGGWPIIVIDGYGSIGGDNRNDRGMPWFRRNYTYEYTSNINWSHGKHNLRAGIDIPMRNLNFIQANVVGNLFGASGGFEFSNGVTQLRGGAAASQDNAFAAFLLGLPQQEGSTYSVPNAYSYYSHGYGAYFRDQWTVTPKLTATLGVRWDYYPFGNRGYRGLESYNFSTNQMNICGVANVPRDCGVSVSKKEFSPRLGIAWRPTDKLVARGGFAISFDPYDFLPQWGFQNFPVQISTDIVGLTTYQSVAPWEQGIPATVPPDTSSGHVTLPPAAIIYTPKTEINRGYIESWNVSLQQSLPLGLVGQISYVANHGVRLMGILDLNAGQVIGAGVAGQPYYQEFGRTASTYRAGPLYASTYNALQVTLEHRLTNGIQLAGNYTWSRAIGTNNGGGFVADTQFYYLNRAILSFNRTQVFNLYGMVQLPFGKDKQWLNGSGVGSKILGGWQLTPLFTVQTGLPFSVTSSNVSLNLPGSTQRANQVKRSVAIYGGGRSGYYFDPLAFASVTTPNFGNASYNSLIGPGIVDLDLGLFRDFPIGERVKLQFRAEAFNATNTPHWANPATNVSSMTLNPDGSILSSGGFAQITATNASNLGRSGTDQRTFRLGVHVSF